MVDLLLAYNVELDASQVNKLFVDENIDIISSVKSAKFTTEVIKFLIGVSWFQW